MKMDLMQPVVSRRPPAPQRRQPTAPVGMLIVLLHSACTPCVAPDSAPETFDLRYDVSAPALRRADVDQDGAIDEEECATLCGDAVAGVRACRFRPVVAAGRVGDAVCTYKAVYYCE